jgi:hypothetical protein
MQFSDNEIIAFLFGTSLSEPGGLYVLLQLIPAVNQKRSATNSGDGKTLRKRHTVRTLQCLPPANCRQPPTSMVARIFCGDGTAMA